MAVELRVISLTHLNDRKDAKRQLPQGTDGSGSRVVDRNDRKVHKAGQQWHWQARQSEIDRVIHCQLLAICEARSSYAVMLDHAPAAWPIPLGACAENVAFPCNRTRDTDRTATQSKNTPMLARSHTPIHGVGRFAPTFGASRDVRTPHTMRMATLARV